MGRRTFAIGDIHGDTHALFALLSKLPTLTSEDTIVFLGDYVDRGPDSKGVIEYIRNLPKQTPAKVVTLRGNHEDAWLRVIDKGWPGFVMPPLNGCLAALRSYLGGPIAEEEEEPQPSERLKLLRGGFFPSDVVDWMRNLAFWFEDEHAIYVHAGLPKEGEKWLHPRDVVDPTVLLWLRDEAFFLHYRGKPVVFGHTVTSCLPEEFSSYTPDDPTDLWAGENVIGIDTGCGKGGFLTCIEFPAMHVYESR